MKFDAPFEQKIVNIPESVIDLLMLTYIYTKNRHIEYFNLQYQNFAAIKIQKFKYILKITNISNSNWYIYII